MTQLEQIKAEIERRIALHKESNHGISIRSEECKELLSFVESLEKEQDVDLEKEYERFVTSDPVYSRLVNGIVGKAIARHFYELGCRHAAEMYDRIEHEKQKGR